MTAPDDATRAAVAELLLTLADDEFILGFWDSEWTGIAPMLEEDVATSSIAQDEIGHAKAWYEMLAALTGDDPDRIAFGRAPEEYRHAALMNHPRTDWAFTVARRFLYETADAVRLESLSHSADAEIAGLAVKMRREETYHLLHWSAWVRRLAEGGAETRERLSAALLRLWPEARVHLRPARRRGTPGRGRHPARADVGAARPMDGASGRRAGGPGSAGARCLGAWNHQPARADR